MSNKKQTAVEWLAEQMLWNEFHCPYLEQAKEIEKQQIKNAFVECWKLNVPDGVECKLDAEQYYKETYEQ
jgi:uncharacterized protein YdeI (YjbR/CyaY-like superfamily)